MKVLIMKMLNFRNLCSVRVEIIILCVFPNQCIGLVILTHYILSFISFIHSPDLDGITCNYSTHACCMILGRVLSSGGGGGGELTPPPQTFQLPPKRSCE